MYFLTPNSSQKFTNLGFFSELSFPLETARFFPCLLFILLKRLMLLVVSLTFHSSEMLQFHDIIIKDTFHRLEVLVSLEGEKWPLYSTFGMTHKEEKTINSFTQPHDPSRLYDAHDIRYLCCVFTQYPGHQSLFSKNWGSK